MPLFPLNISNTYENNDCLSLFYTNNLDTVRFLFKNLTIVETFSFSEPVFRVISIIISNWCKKFRMFWSNVTPDFWHAIRGTSMKMSMSGNCLCVCLCTFITRTDPETSIEYDSFKRTHTTKNVRIQTKIVIENHWYANPFIINCMVWFRFFILFSFAKIYNSQIVK